MNRGQIRKHLELERFMGVDAIPAPSRVEGPAPSRAENRPPDRRVPPASVVVPRPPTASRSPSPSPKPVETGDVPWREEWDRFRAQVLECRKCRLCEKRTQVVFGVGSLTAPLFFIGEGPGEQEDLSGEPFVGRAGQLLTRSLKKFGVDRSQIYISNIVKCRPPQNRTPQRDEVVSCMPYLQRQIRRIAPKIVCALGGPATQALLDTNRGITQLRGRIHEFNGMKIFPTFHPAYILRNMSELGTLETDLSKACREAGLLK